MTSSRAIAALVLLAAVVVAAYANSFHNDFHFDDDHAIVKNPYVRSLRFVPRYFVDARTFSILPQNQSYRPVAQTTFALDYAIDGYDPAVFHVDTFGWFVALLAAVFALTRALAGSDAAAFVATAVFGLHPAIADTVNYIVQRGEIVAALGVVAGLVVFVRTPASRRAGWFLVPVVVGMLAKQSAAAFPLLLTAYLWIYEERVWTRDVWLSIGATVATAVWIAARTPSSSLYATSPATLYRLTQPFVALRYAATFVAPVALSVDYDWTLVRGVADLRVLAGFAFLVAVIAAIVWLRRRPSARAAAFGLAWFLIAQLPTALVPLSEVANNWRMLLPFVGLAIAAASGVVQLLNARSPRAAASFRALERPPAGLHACATRSLPAIVTRPDRSLRVVLTAVVAGVLVIEAVGVHARNGVWRTDESLWRDAVARSPENGRAWMNLGVALMARGDYSGAAVACERALVLAPEYVLVHVNLGVAYGETGRPADAEREFLAAQRLAPDDWRTHLYYGEWLERARRAGEAQRELERAKALNPAAVP